MGKTEAAFSKEEDSRYWRPVGAGAALVLLSIQLPPVGAAAMRPMAQGVVVEAPAAQEVLRVEAVTAEAG